MFQATPVDRADADGRPVRTSMRRGPRSAATVCAACGNWLAVGYDPQEDPAAVGSLLIACNACGSVNDPRAATRLPDAVPPGRRPPAALHATEYWARAAVERVHSLAEQERRWPWRPVPRDRAS